MGFAVVFVKRDRKDEISLARPARSSGTKRNPKAEEEQVEGLGAPWIPHCYQIVERKGCDFDTGRHGKALQSEGQMGQSILVACTYKIRSSVASDVQEVRHTIPYKEE